MNIRVKIFICAILIAFIFTTSQSYSEYTPVNDKNSSLSLIVLNIINDDTYIIDLDINVLEFNKSPSEYEIDILSVINSTLIGKSEKIESMTNFRWSLVGGINDLQRFLGQIGSYNIGVKPWHDGGWRIMQRVKRLGYLLTAEGYTGKNKNISIRKLKTSSGHWNELWHGSFDGLGGHNDMEGRAGKDTMEIWSLFTFEGILEGENPKNPDWDQVTSKKLGDVSLNSDGILSITTDQ